MKIVLKNKGTKENYDGIPVVWGDSDLFTHTLCIGPTRCGKSALAIQQIIKQVLHMKLKGFPIGLSLIEPKGDLAKFTREMCEEMGITDFVHIDPLREDSHIFNVMEGDMDIVAEATVTVLKGMFGKQEQFFAIVQELSARHVTKLLKTLAGDDLDINDLIKTLRNERLMEEKVAELKRNNSADELIEFFDNELLGENKDRYRQFVMGLRAQLENLVSNKKLRRVLTGRSDLNIDEHYEKGGILAINTGLAELGSAGDAFGQFAMMHLQRGAFRRKGTELTRVPHILIVDEASRYVNSEVEVFLAIGAEYRVAGFFALQSSGQLEVESGKLSGLAMKRAFLASCRNRIVFGGLASEDAELLSKELGTEKRLMRQNTYKNNIFLPNLFPDSYRDTEVDEPLFTPSNLRYDIPRFHFVYQLQQEGQPMYARLAKGEFVPRNWKEIRFWEGRQKSNLSSNLKHVLNNLSSLSSKFEENRRAKEEERRYREAELKALQKEKVRLSEEEENESWEVITEALKEMESESKETPTKNDNRKEPVVNPEKEVNMAAVPYDERQYGTLSENTIVAPVEQTVKRENSYENKMPFESNSNIGNEEVVSPIVEREKSKPNMQEQPIPDHFFVEEVFADPNEPPFEPVGHTAVPNEKVSKDVSKAKEGAMF